MVLLYAYCGHGGLIAAFVVAKQSRREPWSAASLGRYKTRPLGRRPDGQCDPGACRCQWPSVSPQLRPSDLPTGGHLFSPLAAMISPHGRVGCCVLVQGRDPLAAGGLRESVAVGPVGDQDVGVVQEPVDGRGRDAFGHQFVKPGGVDV